MNNTIKALVFEPNKEGYVHSIENTLRAKQKIVDGLIEVVHIEDGICLICNEEGMLLELPKHRGIHGTFLIVGDMDGEFISLTDEQITRMKKIYNNRRNYEGHSKYLADFFNEKEIEYKQFHYDIGNTFASIDNIVIINEIMKIQDKQTLAQIEKNIRYIDFKNGDINHFLEFLGRKIAEHQAGVSFGA